MAHIAIENALSGWTAGADVVAQKEFGGDTKVVVTREGDAFTVLRAFSIGDRADVSCDLREASAEEAIAHLLEKGAY